MAKQAEPNNRGAGWQMVALGALLVAAGMAGVVFAWFPAPPHSTTASTTGWPARWFAAGVAWFGIVVAMTGVATIRTSGARDSLRRTSRLAFVLSLTCWAAWLVSSLPR